MTDILIRSLCISTLTLALFAMGTEIARIRSERRRRRQDFLREVERRCQNA